ncbi:hypothetical protein BGZ96_012492, partial [Linnemannia gamsii]
MAGQATVLSDSVSPLRLRKVSGPLVARTSLIFERAALFSQDSDLFSHGDSPILSNYRTAPSSRRSSFTFSNSAFNNNNNNNTNTSNNNSTNNVNSNNKNTASIRHSFSMADLSNLTNRSRPCEEGKVRKLVTSFSNPAFHLNNNSNVHNTHNAHQSDLKRVRSQSVIIECPSAELT